MLDAAKLAHAMRLAALAARQWLGATYPNPPVGAAALDAEGNVLAVAAHRKAGTPHAEAALLELCRAQNLMARIHTLAVTLEPCNHQGRTPPCSAAIIAAGIKHVAIGALDPNPHVKGGGVEALRLAGIEIVSGVERELCEQLIYAFAHSVGTGRPWVTLKVALNEDGTMLPPHGEKTFTSPDSLRFAHRLRKRADAILTGSGTILADDPHFTVRHVADYPDRPRILAIMDRRRRVPQTWLDAAAARGLTPLVFGDLSAAMAELARREIREVLVESGPALSQAVRDSGLWCMETTIQQGAPDRITTLYNSLAALPFAPQSWPWENMLPNEDGTPCS